MPSPSMPIAVVVALVAAGLRAQTDYTFAVDGKQATPEIVSLRGTPATSQRGDLAWIGAWLVRLDGPGHYEFFDERAAQGRLRLRLGGTERVVAVDPERLVAADANARAALRGVRIDRCNDVIATALGSLASDVPVVLTPDALDEDLGTLPRLQPGLQHLALVPLGPIDLSSLASLTALRSLTLGSGLFDSAPKLADIAGFVQLRYLAFRGLAMKPLSLVPLAEITELVQLDIEGAHLSDLPPGAFPKLRHLRLHWTDLPGETVRTFQQHHPACEIRGPVLDAQLQERLRGIDAIALRVVVKTKDEVTPFEPFASEDPRVIAEVLGMLHVADGDGRGYAGIATDTLELRQSGQCVAKFDLLAASLRWRDGPWSNDAYLTPESATRVSAWLTQQNKKVPRAEMIIAAERRAEVVQRDVMRRELIGASLPDYLQRVATADDGIAIGLGALGCHSLPWNTADAVDVAVAAAIATRAADCESWNRAVATIRRDTDAARGLAAAWVLGPLRDALTAEQRANALPIVARAAMRHPEPWNRARMLVALRDEPNDAGLPLLRQVLARELRLPPFGVRRHGSAPTTLPPELVPAADIAFEHADAPVETLAALCLAQRQDTVAAAAIRALAARYRNGAGGTVMALTLAQLERR